MNDIIKLLPDSVANKIAAGEVVQRPASVIKELVENSIDAGASDIRIIIKDAGRTLIQVIDNGKGMSEMDARMAFERHATSKILDAADLFSLRTMGFRGEALPSVCAVSQVELQTKTKDANIGTKVIINGSKLESQESCVCADGTNIKVKNIFYNVPARRKFLKSDNVELSQIVNEFERLALVNHNVRMQIDTGRSNRDLRPGTFRQRIADLWKGSVGDNLIPVEVNTELVRISGYISLPSAKKRKALQYLIVNGRNMRHPYFHKAIMSVYEPLMGHDQQPSYFIRFEVDPNTIDVNIHPTKNEIKFEYEQQIWPILVAAVKSALSKSSVLPSIDFQSDPLTINPLKEGELPAQPRINVPENYNPFTRYSGEDHPQQKRSSTFAKIENQRKERLSNWSDLYSNFMSDLKDSDLAPSKSEIDAKIELEIESGVTNRCIQLNHKYILCSHDKGLMIVDQYRAHVRILYDRYLNQVSGSQLMAQHLMFPEIISLDHRQIIALEEVKSDLLKMGFNLKKNDENSWLITAIPSLLKNSDAKDVILRILDSMNEESDTSSELSKLSDSITDRIALIMARSSAVRRGVELSDDEMQKLIDDLFNSPQHELTPYGKRIYKIIPESSLDSLLNS